MNRDALAEHAALEIDVLDTLAHPKLHDTPRVIERLVARIAELERMVDNRNELARELLQEREAQIAKLQAFKDYTHQRMDELHVPTEVHSSPHTAAGCRIGGRFDYLRDAIAELEDGLLLKTEVIAINVREYVRLGDQVSALKAELQEAGATIAHLHGRIREQPNPQVHDASCRRAYCMGECVLPPEKPIRPSLLGEILTTLRHARIFVASRQKMHPDGVKLYEECQRKVADAVSRS